MLQDRSEESVAGSPPPRPVRRWRVLIIAIVVVVVGGGFYAIHRAASNWYVFAPGSAPLLTSDSSCKGTSELVLPNGTPCVRIQVPAGLASKLTGQLFMVDVEVGPATSIEWVLGKVGLLDHVHQGEVLVPAADYTGGESPSQVACANSAEMSGAQEAAPVAALRRLGYQVTENDKGAVIGTVVAGSPAGNAGLRCNTVITSLNGVAVHTANDLITGLRKHKVGDVITVTTTNGVSTAATTTKITLGPTPAADAAAEKEPTSTPFLGIGGTGGAPIASDVAYDLPFDVSIDAGDIGGPSAGLAFTLGIMDLLSGGKLTGSAKVAATGAIEANGTVDPIGGVAQKAVAVEKAGATVFLVPQANYADAKAAADSHLKVEPVTTLTQALSDLEALGGTVPPTNYALSHPAPPKAGTAS